MTNSNRLFYGSCFALITTAFSFSISAGTLKQLGIDLGYSAENLGYISSLWFFGFPISMIMGGLVYNSIGPKRIMQTAFFTHILGLALTLIAIFFISEWSFITLLISNLLLGIGCGCTEAACNPMIANAYEGNIRNKMLNRFHMWFPGGIVVGALLSEGMASIGLPWESQFWIILIPAIIYFYLFRGQIFPKAKLEHNALDENSKAMTKPLFLFVFVCMALTAITEFGPQKWTGLIMENSGGAKPMIILALVTGLMAIARFFGGPVTKVLGQTGVLFFGAVFSTIGIYLFSSQTGGMTYLAAITFAMGVAFFWPTMIGFVAENIPKSGALGLSVIGGVGMFSTAIFQPIIGGWIDNSTFEQTAKGLTGTMLELVAGQQTLTNMISFPLILIVLFTILYFWQRNAKSTEVV